ncbi:hypothetical protein ACOJIV_27405 [Haloarcula sp. AONF1]
MIQLEVDLPELRMVVVLVPTEEEISFRFNPANPVVVVVSADLDIKADFESYIFCRIAGIP